MIGKKRLLTAAHCTPGLPEREHKLICRGNGEVQTSVISKVIPNESVDLDLMRFEESARNYDNALIKIENELKVPTLPFVSTKAELRDLLGHSMICGIFGHGGFRHNMRQAGLSTNTKIAPEQIILDNDVIRIDGFKGRAAGLVEPGDSGGSLACKDSRNDSWTHIAQVSGRTMDGLSLFAPSYTIAAQLARNSVTPIAPLYEEVRLAMKTSDQGAEAQKCQDKKCVSEKLAALKERLARGEEVTVKLAPYSLIDLDQRSEMIKLDGGRDPERLLERPNPFTTVEGTYNRLVIKKIEGDTVIGDLIKFGYTEYFGCFENIICDGGTFLNITAKIHDLLP